MSLELSLSRKKSLEKKREVTPIPTFVSFCPIHHSISYGIWNEPSSIPSILALSVKKKKFPSARSLKTTDDHRSRILLITINTRPGCPYNAIAWFTIAYPRLRPYSWLCELINELGVPRPPLHRYDSPMNRDSPRNTDAHLDCITLQTVHSLVNNGYQQRTTAAAFIYIVFRRTCPNSRLTSAASYREFSLLDKYKIRKMLNYHFDYFD